MNSSAESDLPAPLFFSFDGVDGGGKSTQVELFCRWLGERGHMVTRCRDPGSTPLGEAVRALLLDRHDLNIVRRSEMLLYMAARAQLVDEVIAPALAKGLVVVSDRYLLANVVYQGHAGGLPVEELWQIGRVATGGLEPRITFVLDVSPEVAQSRMQRELDRMEQQGDDFRTRLREGFLAEARRRPDRVVIVDAGRSIDEVHREIVQYAEAALLKNSGDEAANVRE